MSDSAEMNGSTEPALPRPSTTEVFPPEERFDAGSALMRLLIGGMLVGADEVRLRLWRWDTASRSIAYQATPPEGSPAWFRFALVGMAFEAESRMQRRFSTMLARLTRLADETNDAYMRFAVAVRGTPLEDAMWYLDDAFHRISRTIDGWVAQGWIEEQQGRRIAAHATVSAMDELLEYMAHNPEVRRLIEQQGLGMAESTADEVHDRMASADQWIERFAHSLLRRPVSEKPTESPSSASASASAEAPASASTTTPASSGAQTRAQRKVSTHSSGSG